MEVKSGRKLVSISTSIQVFVTALTDTFSLIEIPMLCVTKVVFFHGRRFPIKVLLHAGPLNLPDGKARAYSMFITLCFVLL